MVAVEKRSFGRVENGLFLSNKMKMSPRISKGRLTNLASLKLIINGNSCICQHYVFRLSLERLRGNFPKIGTTIHLEFRINWLHRAGRHHSTETEEQVVATFRLCRLFCSFVLLCFWFSLKQLIWATQTLWFSWCSVIIFAPCDWTLLHVTLCVIRVWHQWMENKNQVLSQT